MVLEDHERQEPGEMSTPFVRHWQEIPISAREEILYQTYVSPLSTGSQGKIFESTHKLLDPNPSYVDKKVNWILVHC